MNFNRGLDKLLILLFCVISTKVLAQFTINYNAINGIAGNAVRKILIDRSNRVWLGTENGISLLTSNGIENIIYPEEWKNYQVWEIMETPDSCLWIGTFNGEIYLFKNGRFSSIELPISQDNRPVRKMYFKDEQIFVGTDKGLFVIHYKTKQLIPYLSIDRLINIQIMNFFSVNNLLYFNTIQHGIFLVDTQNHHYKKVRYDYLEGQGNFYTQTFGDSLLISRGSSNQVISYNLLALSLENFFTNKAPADSLEMNSLAWKLETTANGDLYAACWGVNDITGGLYKKNGAVMQKINQQYKIESNRIWDLSYHAKNNKLYVASLDKGLYIVDLNTIVSQDSLLKDIDILDLKLLDEELYILSDKEIIKLRQGHILKRLSYEEIDLFLKQNTAGIVYSGVSFDRPLTLREITDLRDQIGITSNRGLIMLDRELNLRGYFGGNGQIRATLLSNNDLIITSDYSSVRLFEDMGEGLHILFSTQDTLNPASVRQICQLNDSLYLFSTTDFKFYLYNQNKVRFSILDNTEKLKFPCYIEQKSRDTVIFLDKSNQLYLGVYHQGSMEIKEFGVS